MIWLKAGVLADPILVGREKELEQLDSLLTSVLQGKGKTILISGEAGSGKTRFTREFLSAAKKQGIGVMVGWCISEVAAPYFPFVEAFNSYFAGNEEKETIIQQPGSPLALGGVAQMVGGERGITAWLTGQEPEKFGRPQMISPEVWKDQIFAGVSKTLHSLSSRQPIILFIEDVQWADSASLALLHYLARVVNGSERVLILGTYRSEELTVDIDGRPHPLADVLRMMRHEDLFEEIKLGKLDLTDVARIAENMIGGSLQDELVQKLEAESGGNPLFLVESLRMLHERRSLVLEDDQWRLAIDEFGLPSKIKDIILRRLSILKYAQRRVLDAASVIGEKFDVELLSNVLGLDILDVLETLNMIAHSTSLVNVDGNFYRFDHAKSRETLYGEISSPLKRGYHARIAERLEASPKEGRVQYSDLTYHYAQAGNTAQAVKYALAAGEDAIERFSNSEAIKHFTYALQTLPEGAESAEARMRAQEGLGDAYYANCMFEETIKTFESLAGVAIGAVKQRAYIKEMEAVWFKGASPTVLMELAKKVEESTTLDCLGEAYVHHNKGRALLKMGNYPETLKEHEEALRVFKEEYYLPKVADLTFAIGTIHVLLGNPQKGFREMLQGLDMFHEMGDARGEMMVAHRGLGYFFLAGGLFSEATKYYTLAFKIAEKIGAYSDMATVWDALGMYKLIQGNTEEALAHSLKALEYAEKTDAEAVRARLYFSLIVRYARAGEPAYAEEYFNKLVKTEKEIVSFSETSTHIFAETALLCSKGLWKEAEEHFERMNRMPYFSVRVWQIGIKTLRAWALGRQGKNDESKSESAEAQRLIDEARNKFAHAVVEADLMARKEVAVGEQFEVRLNLVNLARSSATVSRIEDLAPAPFKIINLPDCCQLRDGVIELNQKTIEPWQVIAIKLILKATKPGNYNLSPCVKYIDDLGNHTAFTVETVSVVVHSVQPSFEILPGRVPTGYGELDRLLLGGIPEKHAVILSSPSIDERELLIGKFLETGDTARETTFDVAVDAGFAKSLAERNSSSFFFLLCNQQADAIVQNLPNVYKLKGIGSLTEIDIALIKLFRAINPEAKGPRRICIEIISDVLLEHHALNTRRWLSALIPTLKSKGFTILAVIDPQMHPSEESQAIRSLFDGEIEVAEKEHSKKLRVRRLSNQRYLDEELVLEREKLLL